MTPENRLRVILSSYTDSYNPIPMLEPKVLYRSVSLPELVDIWYKKKIVGKGNKFNQFDNRSLVFFGDVINQQLIGQGEDITRQIEVKLLNHPIQTRYKKWKNELQKVTDKKQEWIKDRVDTWYKHHIGKGRSISSDQVQTYTRQVTFSYYDDKKIEKLQEKMYNIQQEYRKVFQEERAKIPDLAVSSVILETKPLIGGYHYSLKHGKSGMQDDEYGFPSGFVKLSDIARLHLVKSKKILHTVSPSYLPELLLELGLMEIKNDSGK